MQAGKWVAPKHPEAGRERIVIEVSKRFLQRAFARRYRAKKKRCEKRPLLTEFCTLSGYYRKYAMTLLRMSPLLRKSQFVFFSALLQVYG
jgi:hypothetical protein